MTTTIQAALLKDVFQQAQDGMSSTEPDLELSERARNLCYDALCSILVDDKLGLLVQALQVYPLSIEAWSQLGFLFMDHIDDTEQACRLFRLALDATRRIHPEWEQKEPKDWSVEANHRPIFNAVRGYAVALFKSGNVSEAVEQAECLLQWNPGDFICLELGSWYLRLGRVDAAAAFVENTDCGSHCHIVYTRLLVYHEQFRRGERTISQLDAALHQALRRNLFVPDLLLQDRSFALERPVAIRAGEQSEAVSYVKDVHDLWRNTPYALDWLGVARQYGGRKPTNEHDLIAILRRETLLMTVLDGGQEYTIRGSQCRERMLGTSLASFKMKPEVEWPHVGGQPIYFRIYDWSLDPDIEDGGWRRYTFDNIKEVPFWNVFFSAIERKDEIVA